MNDQELTHFRTLLMGLIDDELTSDERIEIHDALRRSATLREDYESLVGADQRLQSISFIEPNELIARNLWRSPYHRLSRWAGFGLLFGGYALLLLYALVHYLISDTPTLPRFATAAVFLGSILLLASFTIESLKKYKNDPYKEIEK